MNILFIPSVILGAVIVWLLIHPTFKGVGTIVSKYSNSVKRAIEDEEEIENE